VNRLFTQNWDQAGERISSIFDHCWLSFLSLRAAAAMTWRMLSMTSLG
jgi:hypothetical protein